VARDRCPGFSEKREKRGQPELHDLLAIDLAEIGNNKHAALTLITRSERRVFESKRVRKAYLGVTE